MAWRNLELKRLGEASQAGATRIITRAKDARKSRQTRARYFGQFGDLFDARSRAGSYGPTAPSFYGILGEAFQVAILPGFRGPVFRFVVL